MYIPRPSKCVNWNFGALDDDERRASFISTTLTTTTSNDNNHQEPQLYNILNHQQPQPTTEITHHQHQQQQEEENIKTNTNNNNNKKNNQNKSQEEQKDRRMPAILSIHHRTSWKFGFAACTARRSRTKRTKVLKCSWQPDPFKSHREGLLYQKNYHESHHSDWFTAGCSILGFSTRWAPDPVIRCYKLSCGAPIHGVTGVVSPYLRGLLLL